MATNLALDDKLLKLTLKVGGFKTKKESVNAALKELLERHKQYEIINDYLPAAKFSNLC